MDSLLLALLGYPLGVLANFTFHKLKELAGKIDLDPLKRLFIKAFYKSLSLFYSLCKQQNIYLESKLQIQISKKNSVHLKIQNILQNSMRKILKKPSSK